MKPIPYTIANGILGALVLGSFVFGLIAIGLGEDVPLRPQSFTGVIGAFAVVLFLIDALLLLIGFILFTIWPIDKDR